MPLSQFWDPMSAHLQYNQGSVLAENATCEFWVGVYEGQ